MSRWVGLTPPAPSAHGWLPTTRSVLREALHPPLREASFWAVQVAVVTLAGLHFYLDSAGILESTAFPTGSPVGLLLLPVLLRLMGRSAWYLPKWARRILPNVTFGHA